jgi:hypothetical protein
LEVETGGLPVQGQAEQHSKILSQKKKSIVVYGCNPSTRENDYE